MRKTDSLEITLILGKIEGKRSREGQRMRCLDGITDLMMGDRELTEAQIMKSLLPNSDLN